jgi:hypothetical protein
VFARMKSGFHRRIILRSVSRPYTVICRETVQELRAPGRNREEPNLHMWTD